MVVKQSQFQPECRTFSGCAIYSDPSPHQASEVLGDRQAQSRSAIPARRGRIRLCELVKDLRLTVFGNSNSGVLHGDPDEGVALTFFRAGDVYQDLPALSEFDCVAGEIQRDLAEAPRIADKPARCVGGVAKDQVQALFGSSRGQQLDRALDFRA